MRTYYKDGIGGSVKAELALGQGLSLTGSAGYMFYPTNTYYVYMTAYPPGHGLGALLPSSPPPYKFIPLKAGFRYAFVRVLYITAEAGEALKANDATKNNFIYAGGAGIVIPISLHHGIDVSARYENGYKITNSQYSMHQIAIRLAYRLGL